MQNPETYINALQELRDAIYVYEDVSGFRIRDLDAPLFELELAIRKQMTCRASWEKFVFAWRRVNHAHLADERFRLLVKPAFPTLEHVFGYR